DCDVVVSCAAVADFTPSQRADVKLKRGNEQLVLELQPTPDIAAALGRQKKNGQLLIGFALETNDEACNAIQKLHKKNLDLIVLNSLRDANAGFGYDTNKVTMIDREERQYHYELKTKRAVARDIAERVIKMFCDLNG
ncbi:MAG: phosphopantothenoylcysteine decarboxylase, partial [Odoribacter sp.]|nr:phosphopantothenoylcysteine decarboxylase [Odoribacter sp.]